MGLLNLIFGRESNSVYDLLHAGEANPDFTGRPKYWTRQNVDWSDVKSIRVDGNSVFAVRDDTDDELIATRTDHRTAMGYANAVSSTRHIRDIKLPVIITPTHQA